MKFIKWIGGKIMSFIDNIINKIRGIKQTISANIPISEMIEIKRDEYIKNYGHEQQVKINNRRRREEIARQSRREHYAQAKI